MTTTDDKPKPFAAVEARVAAPSLIARNHRRLAATLRAYAARLEADERAAGDVREACLARPLIPSKGPPVHLPNCAQCDRIAALVTRLEEEERERWLAALDALALEDSTDPLVTWATDCIDIRRCAARTTQDGGR